MELIENIKKKIQSLPKLFSKKSHVEVEIISGIDVDSLVNDPNAREIILNKQREEKEIQERTRPKYEGALDNLASVQKVNDMPKKGIGQLETLAKLYSNTLLEKEYYKYRVENQNKEVTYLEGYEEEIPKAIEKIKEHEERQRLVKRDLTYLEGERGDINYQNNRYNKSLKFIKSFLIGLVVVAAIATFILATMSSVYNHDIFLPALVIIVILMFFGMWLYIFRRYVIHGLKKNQRLQKRLIELMNKTKIKYVNNQQFLDFEYQKYRVNSSEMLELRWENYRRDVTNINKFQNIANNISALVVDVQNLLENNNNIDIDFVIDNIDYFMSKKSRKTLQSNLESEVKQLKKELNRCEHEQQILSQLLTNLGF